LLDYESKKPGNLQDVLSDFSFVPLLANLAHPEITTEPWAAWPKRDSFIALTGVVGEQTIGASGKGIASSKKGPGSLKAKRWKGSPICDAVETVLKEIRAKHPTLDSVVVLSHLARSEDHELASKLRQTDWLEWGLILGGHDHDIDFVERHKNKIILTKNLSNAGTVTLIILTWPMLFRSALWDEWRRANRSPEAQPATYFQNIPNRARAYCTSVLSDQLSKGRTIIDTIHGLIEEAEALKNIRIKLDAVEFDEIPPLWRVQASIDAYRGMCGLSRSDPAFIDFSKEIHSLDARDEFLRTRTTDFGNFTTDSIRLALNGELVILNSGAFRIDSFVPPAINTATLRETFLYDGRDALIRLQVPLDACEAMLRRGIKMHGSGGFPQISYSEGLMVDSRSGRITKVDALAPSGRKKPAKRTISLVISKFLLSSDEDEDKYLAALQEAGYARKEVAKWLSRAANKTASIIQSVRDGAEKGVLYDPLPRLLAFDAADDKSHDREELIDIFNYFLAISKNLHGAVAAVSPKLREIHERIVGPLPHEVRKAGNRVRETARRIAHDHGRTYLSALLEEIGKDHRGFHDPENAETGHSRYQEIIGALDTISDA
jgi:hypothetical protein